MKSKEELIYDLIFSEQTQYRIEVSEYIDDIYKYDRFIDEIKSILKKSKVILIKDKINLQPSGAIWTLKLKK